MTATKSTKSRHNDGGQHCFTTCLIGAAFDTCCDIFLILTQSLVLATPFRVRLSFICAVSTLIQTLLRH